MLSYTAIHTVFRIVLFWVIVVGLSGNPAYADSGNYPSSSCDGKIFPKYETAYAYYLRGNGCAEDERYTRAIEDYSRALELEPEYDLVFAQRGRAYFNQGDYELATADYTEYVRRTGRMESFIEEHLVVMQSPPPDVEEAETPVVTCDQTIDPETEMAQVYFNRGVACFEAENYEPVMADLLAAVEREEDYYALALAYFNHVIDTTPNDAEAYVIRGRIYVMAHEFDLAFADFDQALALDPESSRAYMGRGSAYVLQKENEKALADLSRAIEIDPEYTLAYRTRGGVYGRMDDSDSAFADINRALELSPEDVELYAMRSALYLVRAGAEHDNAYCDKALDDAKQVLALASTDQHRAAGYKARGGAYACLENASKAIADFEKYEDITGEMPSSMKSMIEELKKTLTLDSAGTSSSSRSSRSSRSGGFNFLPLLIGMGVAALIQHLRKSD